ncbi:MAG: hypothetical protein WCL53_05100 [Chloroflexota bacterium]
MDVCWTCIGALRARTRAARSAQRTCARHADGAPTSLVRWSSEQARAGQVQRPQLSAGRYRRPQPR